MTGVISIVLVTIDLILLYVFLSEECHLWFRSKSTATFKGYRLVGLCQQVTDFLELPSSGTKIGLDQPCNMLQHKYWIGGLWGVNAVAVAIDLACG